MTEYNYAANYKPNIVTIPHHLVCV